MLDLQRTHLFSLIHASRYRTVHQRWRTGGSWSSCAPTVTPGPIGQWEQRDRVHPRDRAARSIGTARFCGKFIQPGATRKTTRRQRRTPPPGRAPAGRRSLRPGSSSSRRGADRSVAAAPVRCRGGPVRTRLGRSSGMACCVQICTHLSLTGAGTGSRYRGMNGRQFIARVHKWARSRNLEVRFVASEGAGSRGTLHAGDRKTTVRD